MASEFGKLTTLYHRYKGDPSDTVVLFANGLNQVEVEVTIKLHDKKNDPWIPSNVKDWIYFCDFESGETINSTWTVSEQANDYTRHVGGVQAELSSDVTKASDVVLISKYLSSSERDSRIIFAVGINIPGIGKFDTSRFGTDTINGQGGSGSKFNSPSKLNLASRPEIRYTPANTNIDKTLNLEESKNEAFYDVGITFTKTFKCNYDNYYISLDNGIRNANIHGYGSIDGNSAWISAHSSYHDDQHMIVAHPFNFNDSSDRRQFGYVDRVHWSIGAYCDLHLQQDVTFNIHKESICFTQMTFLTGDGWEIPDNVGTKEYHFDTWFEIWDYYGNYGKFNVKFTADHQFIDITSR